MQPQGFPFSSFHVFISSWFSWNGSRDSATNFLNSSAHAFRSFCLMLSKWLRSRATSSSNFFISPGIVKNYATHLNRGWVYKKIYQTSDNYDFKKNKFWYKLTSRTSFLRMILINKNIQYGVQNGLLTLFLIYRLDTNGISNKIFEPLVINFIIIFMLIPSKICQKY